MDSADHDTEEKRKEAERPANSREGTRENAHEVIVYTTILPFLYRVLLHCINSKFNAATGSAERHIPGVT